MKKSLIVFLMLPLLTGCYAISGGIPLYDSYGFNYTPQSVVVQKGDTLYKLSQRYKVSLNGIIEKNNLQAPYSLNIGQVLYLPTTQKHVVQKGETLYGISQKYNVNISAISKLNSLDAPYSLNVGQILELPSSVENIKQASSGGGSSRFSTSKISSKKVASAQNKTKSAVSKNTKQASSSAKRKNVSTYRKTKFVWPVNGSVVSNFGFVGKGRKNDGINIKAALGTNIKAADKGVVAYAGNELKGFGNLVLIKHSDGYITAYAHADKIYVKKGQTVLRGEKIATVGKTGSVNTPQLHFEVRAGKRAVNPRQYLP
ncbi:MAG: peptidoglycan DD-metalloendopeptidase family protein [Alphaproteobacteria bacterium]|nr:peptidoglycan DD-metalloendopeptidase family protein [Alphaproteobacteria bacterium]